MRQGVGSHDAMAKGGVMGRQDREVDTRKRCAASTCQTQFSQRGVTSRATCTILGGQVVAIPIPTRIYARDHRQEQRDEQRSWGAAFRSNEFEKVSPRPVNVDHANDDPGTGTLAAEQSPYTSARHPQAHQKDVVHVCVYAVVVLAPMRDRHRPR